MASSKGNTMSYEDLVKINHDVEEWCNKHFPGKSDEDFKRMAKSADVEYLDMLGAIDICPGDIDRANAAWDRFQYLARSAIDG